MQRLRLYDLRVSRLPALLGLCVADVPGLAAYVNSAQRRLLMAKEAGEEGWWGTWAEIAFEVSRDTPSITLPREVARIESIVVCDRVYPMHNQFYEYLEFGNGRWPRHFFCDRGMLAGYARNNAVCFTDLTPPKYVAVYPQNTQDIGKSAFLSGYDSSGHQVFTQNPQLQTVAGEFVTMNQPFSQSATLFGAPLTGIQKDVTAGPVSFYSLDPNTAEQTLLLTMQPTETTASYRRYYFNQLPCTCCPQGAATEPGPVQVKAIAKLDLIPVAADTDYCLIQNLEALIEECQSVRYSEMDTPTAKTMAAERHVQAIRMLNGELNHFIGQKSPAIQMQVFGSARLEKQRIGTLI